MTENQISDIINRHATALEMLALYDEGLIDEDGNYLE